MLQDNEIQLGAARSAPTTGRSLYIQRAFVGRSPSTRASSVSDLARVQSTEPLCTVGASLLRGPCLDGARFEGWARYPRCRLNFELLRTLENEAWDVWRASQVMKGEKGSQRTLVRLCEGAHQIPQTVACDRAFVREPMAAEFVALMNSYLRTPNVDARENPVRLAIHRWGTRLPNYSQGGRAPVTLERQWHSFEWALLKEGGLVVTWDDWEVTKGVSSQSAFERMSVAEIIAEGFHVPLETFPATPEALRGPASVPAGLAIPPLWSLRFFAAHVLGNGSPRGSNRSNTSIRQRLLDVLEDELVVCIALGVTAERFAHQRTPILPSELIGLILGYDGPNIIPTVAGPVSIRDVGERLKNAYSVPRGRWVEERPLHVLRPLYYAPDGLINPCVAEQLLKGPSSRHVTAPREMSPVFTPPAPLSTPRVPVESFEALGREGHAPGSSAPLGSSPSIASRALPNAAAPSRVALGSAPAVVQYTHLPQAQFPECPVVVAQPLERLVSSRLHLDEFQRTYPFLRCALWPLREKNKTSLHEVLECLSGWVRRADPQARLPPKRGSRGGTVVELRRVRVDLEASRRDGYELRRQLREMTDRLTRVSAHLEERVNGKARKRPRVEYEGAPPPGARHEN